MKAIKVELLILDFDELGEDGVREVIQNTHYPNRCITPEVKSMESVDIDWSDNHPLNNCGTSSRAYQDLFAKI